MKHGINLFVCLIMYTAIFSQQVISLYDGPIPNSVNIKGVSNKSIQTDQGEVVLIEVNPTLTIYLPPQNKATGAAVIVCPGGGYSALVLSEGDTIAKRFRDAGIAGFVLRYRLPDHRYVRNKEIVPLQDAQHALIVVRQNAKKWGVDPDRVGMLGSSAGGHLVSTIATHFNNQYDANRQHINTRPDFILLNYPVISFADSLTRFGCRFKLTGPEISTDEWKKIETDWGNSEKYFVQYPIDSNKIKEYSNELHVTPNTPPAFITHAADDNVVKIMNSILFIAALQKNNVEVKSFFYAKGGHGYGINNFTSSVNWVDSCIKWIVSGEWKKKV